MLGHNISLATGVCFLWPFMAASWLKKYPNDAVDIAVAEGGATVGEMCVWWVMAAGEKMADGDEHTIFIHQWVWLFWVGKQWMKKCIWGRMETNEEFTAGEMCISIKASMRMLAADEDELAMVALFCSFLRVCVDGNEWVTYFYILCHSTANELLARLRILLAKWLGKNFTYQIANST